MPYSIRTKDGITISNIPDDVPKDDPRLKAMVAQLRAAGQKEGSFAASGAPQAAPVPQGATAPQTVQPSSVWGDVGAGSVPVAPPQAPTSPQEPRTDLAGLMGAAVRGAGPIAGGALLGAAMGAPIGGVGAVPGAAAGAAAMGLTQFVGDPLVDLINNILGTQIARPTDALQQLFTRIGVPEPDTAAERVVQAAASGAGGAAGMVALGQALSSSARPLAPSITKALGDALKSGVPQQIAGGIGGGGAAQTAAEMGASPGVQLAAGVGGGMAASALGGLRAGPSKYAAAPLDEAAAAGVRIMPSDVSPPKTGISRWFQARVNELPFGPGVQRAEQYAQKSAAVRDVLRQFGADDLAAASNDVMDDLVKTRGAALTKWTTAKKEVIDGLTPSGAVPMKATMDKIDESVAMLQKMKTKQVQPVITTLTDWKQAIQDQDLATIELLRKQIGDVFSAPDMASVRSTGEKVLSGIYGAVNDDMGAYIKAAGKPNDFAKWKVANTELANMARELDRPVLKAALEKGNEAPEYIANILFSRKRSDVEALYRNLSPEGKAAARAAVLAKAAGEAGENISPDKFAKNIKKMADQVGVIFDGDDLQRVEGLRRVIEFTEQAGPANVMPKTGVQTMPLATFAATSAGLGHLLHLGTPEALAMGAGVTITGAMLPRAYNAAFSWAVKNPEVRGILKRIPSVVRGSPEELALMKRLLIAAQAVNQSPSRGAGENRAPGAGRDPGRAEAR